MAEIQCRYNTDEQKKITSKQIHPNLYHQDIIIPLIPIAVEIQNFKNQKICFIHSTYADPSDSE